MKLISLILLIAIVGCLSLGCTASTLRFAPNEAGKQAATAANQLSQRLAATGAAPGDPGLAALSMYTQPAASYAGPPADPLNVAPLAEASRGKWPALEQANTMLELRDRWSRKIAEAVSNSVTALAIKIAMPEEGKTIGRQAVVDELSALQLVSVMAIEFADEIKIPEGPKTSQELRDQIAAAQADSLDMLLAANKAAAMRPSGRDVANEVVDQTNGVLDYAGELIEANPGLTTLLGLAGLGGGGTWLRTRSKRRRGEEIELARADERKTNETNTLRSELTAASILLQRESVK
jgi:hypothetical protein